MTTTDTDYTEEVEVDGQTVVVTVIQASTTSWVVGLADDPAAVLGDLWEGTGSKAWQFESVVTGRGQTDDHDEALTRLATDYLGAE